MRRYYSELKKLLEKGALKRITDLETGEEGLYRDGSLILSTSGYGEPSIYSDEIISMRPTLVLFGFGHIGKSIYRISEALEFPLIIFDDRKNIADDELYEKAEIIIEDYDKIFQRQYSFDNPYFLIFTHGHKWDEEALYYVLSRYRSRYVGMIGSRKKIELTYSNLEKRGIDKELLKSVHSPIGIDINAQSPQEIAISILAEVIKTFREDKRQITIDSSMLDYLQCNEDKTILVRIVEKEGSGPREQGVEMAVTESDVFSTIGGGAIEVECIKEARKMLKNGEKFRILDFNLEKDGALNMACGGKTKVMFRLIM